MKAFRSFPTTRSTLAAMQRCPADPNAEFMMSLMVMSSSASGMAIRWFLAPPMQSERFPVARAALSRSCATRELPTKENAATPGCSAKAEATGAAPCTSEKTPGGQPASERSSAKRLKVRGTFSLGFMMRQLPQAIAMGNVHRGTMAGKLKGTTEATTPMGRRTSWQKTPRATSRTLPASISGRPVAKETVSRPLSTSASASPLFLPCSNTTSSVSSARCASQRLLNRKSTSTRALTGVSRQPGKAAAAALTARSTSSAPPSGTRAIASPVDGLVTGKDLLANDGMSLPPTKSCNNSGLLPAQDTGTSCAARTRTRRSSIMASARTGTGKRGQAARGQRAAILILIRT
mmetsp:Transcript_87590/g.194816  ORF Transcript_87590/g.194816 Transcript_87590/m.194816 type:complete len:348 (+) Transcript_87590:536-1579(+)